MASFPKPPSADETVEMDRLPDFDDLETLVADAERKASVSPDATVRMPALNLPKDPPSGAGLPDLPKDAPQTARLSLPKDPPATARLNLPKAPPPSARAAPKVGDKTVLRPGGQVELKTILRPSVAPESAAAAPPASTAKVRPRADSLPQTIVDFGGDKASVAPVAMPTHESPSSPSAWPPLTSTHYRVPRTTWPLTALTLAAVFASFVTLGAAIVAAWDRVPPGVAHAAASTLVLPASRPGPSSSAPLQPLTPATSPPRTSAPRPRDMRVGPAKGAQVSDNPYDDSAASASPPPAPPATAAPPAPAPADGKDGSNEADKKLEDLIRSLQR